MNTTSVFFNNPYNGNYCYNNTKYTFVVQGLNSNPKIKTVEILEELSYDSFIRKKSNRNPTKEEEQCILKYVLLIDNLEQMGGYIKGTYICKNGQKYSYFINESEVQGEFLIFDDGGEINDNGKNYIIMAIKYFYGPKIFGPKKIEQKAKSKGNRENGPPNSYSRILELTETLNVKDENNIRGYYITNDQKKEKYYLYRYPTRSGEYLIDIYDQGNKLTENEKQDIITFVKYKFGTKPWKTYDRLISDDLSKEVFNIMKKQGYY